MTTIFTERDLVSKPGIGGPAGDEDRSAMTQLSREQPRELDEQVAQMKGDLEAAVANHRCM